MARTVSIGCQDFETIRREGRNFGGRGEIRIGSD